jgi:hypothetical protein
MIKENQRQSVENVKYNVLLAKKRLLIVLNVPQEELIFQLVIVQKDNTKRTENVTHVATDVMLVLKKQATVLIVLKKESIYQIVSVKPDLSIMVKTRNVLNVLKDVKHVILVENVKNVLMEESEAFVNVQMDIMNHVLIQVLTHVMLNANNPLVLNVTEFVILVMEMPNPARNVHQTQTEKKPQSVNVKKVSMIMAKERFGHHVTMLVKHVKEILQIVSHVKREELIHQNVNVLQEHMMTVNHVNLVEYNVKLVHPKTHVLNVPETEKIQPFVLVLLEPTILVKRSVHLVMISVILVSKIKTNV